MENNNKNQTLEQKLAMAQNARDNYASLGVISCLTAISGAGFLAGIGLYLVNKSSLEMISNPYVAAASTATLLFGPTLAAGITACLSEYKMDKLELKCKKMYADMQQGKEQYGIHN